VFENTKRIEFHVDRLQPKLFDTNKAMLSGLIELVRKDIRRRTI
jgi:hypothetical protein